ncbi:flavin-containing monooxygenase [Alteriqipengyuania lutimaris]|uniref:NAD(P)/FAD-dependent oxidoreductase n=2 Tax=Alteriqipengyuania lutimaris TaxID=1538146 RepID=A0A395LNC0_9SPHN|nr:NAD(P)/FAD-dependent oxidoreductase [Alteriqipengyuania lutimaris]MBB3033932.1 cation diffusion facilitator CzcD-associated flavoprotein CzcO [Alteriqipengyuania lutimaris]RDS78553.1 NAD(P)/FAD-dependent oxidoreductase [Alteriqipengyuania lutimaris]
MDNSDTDFDVLIVGAGISGIGMAAHLETECPDKRYAILERRERLGGTWDLFRYPGVRSDSDMHTLGFVFEPWRHEKSIADGAAILDYLDRIVDERGIRENIRFGMRVETADFDSATARWVVTVVTQEGERKRLTGNWLYLGSGYYDYDEPYDPGFELGEFEGQVVHPQFWPDDLGYEGKNVVVIGSGATAVTIVPAMAEKAASVTMLQRTPTWMFSRPARDGLANFLRKILPEDTAYKITRWKNVVMQDIGFKRAQSRPEKVKEFLIKKVQGHLGDKYDARAFTPPYDPWDQRLCLVPDADLFEAIKRDRAQIVTGRIARFAKNAVVLEDGREIAADILVTATGLKLAVAGKIVVSVDGEPVDFAQRYYYKGCMFSNLPNLAVVFGYLNASWTLRADLNAAYVCDVLNEMDARGVDIAVPQLTGHEAAALEDDDIFDFSSGYIQRSKAIMPKNAVSFPWRLNQDYRVDRKQMKSDPIDDGILHFKALSHAPADEVAPERSSTARTAG